MESTNIETKPRIKLSPTNFCLLIRVRFKPKPLKKTNIMQAIDKAIQPLGSIPLRLLKKTKIKPKT